MSHLNYTTSIRFNELRSKIHMLLTSQGNRTGNDRDQRRGRMRFLVLALVFALLSSSCLASYRKALHVEIIHGPKQRQLAADHKDLNAGYPGSRVNNHHYIPRQDFNNFGGDGGDGGSG
ncbi:hypothetical protein SADUNF_Sadunf04G0153500 [Salix dunnii]|uniref:Uncharacterized protein n=1 Tax=Salix dunnii TaxID=1413687 RepID=A0A835KCB4_9ROSI|nr:hypothetical protein SADUNF_Sadunf04G0153500 [Salix dunnii]